MDKELVSIIVPIYNVEKYLIKCIESILNQTYKNLEIILVDDGSTDSCNKICDRYKKIDKRVVVIHKKNGGLSSARNIGIKKAKGKLISFVDSDDYIKPNMIEELKNNMYFYNSDISVCDYYYIIDGKRQISDNNNLKRNCITKYKNKFIYKPNSAVWNKLYKKNLFEQIKFPEGKIYEDDYILYELLDKAN